MNKVLYIKADPKPAGTSRTVTVSDAFVDRYKTLHPEDEIIEVNLYEEDIRFLTQEDIGAAFGPKTEESKNHPILRYAYQFLSADKYIIASPFWNLSFPAILKAYVDYVSISGITFQYTEHGPKGMCSGKAVHFVSRGGQYVEGPSTGFEMGDRYLRVLFGFLGITDFETVAIEGVDMYGANVDKIIEQSIRKAELLVEEF